MAAKKYKRMTNREKDESIKSKRTDRRYSI